MINLLKIRKKEQKIRKSIERRKYSKLKTIRGKEYSTLQPILLEVIGERKYSKLENSIADCKQDY